MISEAIITLAKHHPEHPDAERVLKFAETWSATLNVLDESSPAEVVAAFVELDKRLNK